MLLTIVTTLEAESPHDEVSKESRFLGFSFSTRPIFSSGAIKLSVENYIQMLPKRPISIPQIFEVFLYRFTRTRPTSLK